MALAPRVFLTLFDDDEPRRPPADLPAGSLHFFQLTSRAFGDGSHPTMCLAARAVDLLCRQRAPRSVLDVGAGTGILARIARAHGAQTIVATEVDEEALRMMPRQLALDDSRTPITVLDARAQAADAWSRRYDLVVANILEDVLRELEPALVASIAPGGALLLSGFTRAQTPSLRASFERAGARVDVQADAGEWVLLQLALS